MRMHSLLRFPHISVKLYGYHNIMPWKLPGVEIKPIIRHLDLVSIMELLLEDTISIS